MNCKPGDLAITTRSLSARMNKGEWVVSVPAGRIVRLTTRGPDGVFGPTWLLECPIPIRVVFPCGYVYEAKYTAISDCALRPLRDPGDDAVDEMVRIVGRPREWVFPGPCP